MKKKYNYFTKTPNFKPTFKIPRHTEKKKISENAHLSTLSDNTD